MEETDKSKREPRSITISEDGSIVWSKGMRSIYEVFGFIDLHVNPDAIKAVILRKISSIHEDEQGEVKQEAIKEDPKEVG